MPETVVMMGNTQEIANLSGEPCKADGWYGNTDGLHTVVIQVVNFTGRIYIEASLALEPTADDWFPVKLTDTTAFVQYPQDQFHPTGDQDSGGDTSTIGFTFKINAVWLRARLDRTYISYILYQNDPAQLAAIGNVKKIVLAR